MLSGPLDKYASAPDFTIYSKRAQAGASGNLEQGGMLIRRVLAGPYPSCP